MKSISRAVTGAVLIVALGACSTDEPSHAESQAAEPAAPDVWSTQLENGTVVRLRPQSVPVREGRTTFLIELDPAPTDTPAVTVDILSPSMPAHGIARYDAVAAGPGRFRADAEIPMAGDWSLYVNLDAGETAAPFSFDAVAADGTAPADHASHGHVHPSEAENTDSGESGGLGPAQE